MSKRNHRAAFAAACLLSAASQSVWAQSPAVPPAASQSASPTPFGAVEATDRFASNLIDVEVSGPDGKRLGEIEDLVFDASGQIRAAVLALGVKAGSGERHVLVQFGALHLTRGQGVKWQAELDVPPDQLMSAPTIPYRSGWNE